MLYLIIFLIFYFTFFVPQTRGSLDYARNDGSLSLFHLVQQKSSNKKKNSHPIIDIEYHIFYTYKKEKGKLKTESGNEKK